MAQNNNGLGWTQVLGGASSGLNLLQGGFNFVKDLFGTDYGRSAQLQKEMLAAQFGYNRQLASDQHDYNLEMASIQNAYQKALMEQSQGYNLTNMQRQYLYNSFLSNKGRDIYAMRMSGINPASGTGSPSGSVSLPSAPQGAAGSFPAGLPSVAGGASSPTSHYQPIDGQVGNTIRNLSESNLTDEQAKEQRIKNIYAAQKQIMELEKMKMEVTRGLTDKEKTDREVEMMLSTWNEQIGIARATLKKLLNEADSIPRITAAKEKEAQAAVDNADTNKVNAETNRFNAQTNYYTFEELRRNNLVNNALRNKELGLQERVVKYNEKNAEEVYKEIQERVTGARLDNKRKATENEYVAELIASQIYLNREQEAYYYQLKRRNEKEADAYEVNMLLNHAENFLNGYSNYIRSNASAQSSAAYSRLSEAQEEYILQKAAELASGRHTGTHTFTTHGMTPQGRPTTETWTAPWTPAQ